MSSRTRLVPLALAALLAQALPAQAPAPLAGVARWADSARRVIEEGVVTGDTDRLQAGTAVVARALRAWPTDPLLLHYAGYAAYRAAMLKADTDTARERLLEAAIDQLERSAELRPLAETHALLGAAHGALAGTGMLAGMRHGPKASAAQDEARRLGPRNPRVLMLAATGAWFTPSMWGGGKDKARTLLAQAIAAFETDAPAAPLPAWGRAEAYAWHGQFEADAGRTAAARAAYDRALALEPRFAWVRDVLRPALAAR
jgi:tetratricopeptide (TPR) repeat protein